MGKYKIFVDGSSGTTGLRIADRLAERDEFEILKISAADRKDVHARAAVINESDLSLDVYKRQIPQGAVVCHHFFCESCVHKNRPHPIAASDGGLGYRFV